MDKFVTWWVAVVAICFLVRYPLQKKSMELGLFSFFLGLFILGLGFLAMGGYYMTISGEDAAQFIVNLVSLVIGGGCIWVSAGPLMQIVRSWFV